MARHPSQTQHSIVPVIMAGGSGKRLWPLSRLGYPKQFQAFGGNRSPFMDTLLRLRSWVPNADRPIIVTAQEHYHIVKQQLDAIRLKPLAIVLEPEARETAPAVTAAAMVAESLIPGATLLISPCDQIIHDSKQMAGRIFSAAQAAAAGDLVVFGLTPSETDSNARYLHADRTGRDDGFLQLRGFFEGQSPADLRSMQGDEDGRLLMNSGIYCFTAEALLREAARFAPEMLRNCRRAVARGEVSGNVYRLASAPFAALPRVSLGDAVLGRSQRTVVARLDMKWNDLGSWETLWNLGLRDSDDNVRVGDTHVLDCKGVYARSEGPLTAVYGVDDLVVVSTADAVLVARRDDPEGVQKIHNHLTACGRSDVLAKRQRREDWGWVETIEQTPTYALRRIVVHPGCSLPVERHHQRSETLTVVSGRAHVWLNGEMSRLSENESVTVPQRCLHYLENPTGQRLEMIEIQTGNVIGEEDRIVLDDSWKGPLKTPVSNSAAIADSEARSLLVSSWPEPVQTTQSCAAR
ncbi:MAG: mannose-1-phosphate guanylyltransferase/mannose-6-phosphate isomerase [Kiloniellaceae bacterium]